jgi:hypothetical protein
MKKLILTAVLMTSSLLAENFANLQITNSTIFVNAQAHIAKEDPIYLRGGYLINKNKHNFVYAGIKSEGNLLGDNSSIMASLFIDRVYTKDYSAMPIGIGASSYLPFLQVPTFIRGEIEYAPEILSFDKANRFLKANAEIGMQFIENAEAFVGYRNISFNHTYNNAIYAGVGFNF